MPTVSELKAKAAELRRIADKLDDAAKALEQLDGVHGHGEVGHPTVRIIPRDLSELPGLEAIYAVLETQHTPMKKSEILREMANGGKVISPNTLDVYLSQNRNLFESCGEGRWKLKK